MRQLTDSEMAQLAQLWRRYKSEYETEPTYIWPFEHGFTGGLDTAAEQIAAQEDALGSCREAFEGVEAENERLRAALKPFARIAGLSGFPKGINVTLWERTTNVEGEDRIAITLADCIEAQRTLEGSDPH